MDYNARDAKIRETQKHDVIQYPYLIKDFSFRKSHKNRKMAKEFTKPQPELVLHTAMVTV